MGQIHQPGISQLQDYTQPSYCRVTIFLVYGRDPNLLLHQLLEPMQHFLGDPDSGKLHLETHRLALAIAKKTLDENRFKGTQKTNSRNNPAFQVGDHVYFKNKQPGKWDLKWRPGYQKSVLSAMDISSTLKTKPQEKHDPAMCQILFSSLLSSLGMSTPSLPEQAAILITQLIYPQYKSLIHLGNIAMRFQNFHLLYHH